MSTIPDNCAQNFWISLCFYGICTALFIGTLAAYGRDICCKRRRQTVTSARSTRLTPAPNQQIEERFEASGTYEELEVTTSNSYEPVASGLHAGVHKMIPYTPSQSKQTEDSRGHRRKAPLIPSAPPLAFDSPSSTNGDGRTVNDTSAATNADQTLESKNMTRAINSAHTKVADISKAVKNEKTFETNLKLDSSAKEPTTRDGSQEQQQTYAYVDLAGTDCTSETSKQDVADVPSPRTKPQKPKRKPVPTPRRLAKESEDTRDSMNRLQRCEQFQLDKAMDFMHFV